MNLSDLWWLIVGKVLAYNVGAEGKKYTLISPNITYQVYECALGVNNNLIVVSRHMFVDPILHDWIKLAEKHELFIDEIDTDVSQEDKLPVPHKQAEIFAKEVFLEINNLTICYSFSNLAGA